MIAGKLQISLAVVLLLAVASCGTTSGGPEAWFDVPRNNASVPFDRMTLHAHASDADGVTRFEFFVNGEEHLSPDVEGNLLEDAMVEWNPPVPGRYVIGVRAIDSLGNAGHVTTSIINISGSVPEGITPIPPDDAVAEVITDTPTPTITLTPTLSIPIVVARQNSNCREGPGTAFDIYGTLFEAEEAIITGRLSDNFWLRVTLPDRSSDCWISASVVDIQGELAEVAVVAAPPPPEAPPPPADDQPPEPDDGDTTPPGIFGVAFSLNSMTKDYDTVNSNVIAYDDSGIDQVYASWSLKQGGSVVYSGSVVYDLIPPYTDNVFTAVFGPFDEYGTLTINGTVVDNAGNTTSFSDSIEVD